MFCLPLEAAPVLTEIHPFPSGILCRLRYMTRREIGVPTTPILIICRRFLGWVDIHFVIPIGNSTNTIGICPWFTPFRRSHYRPQPPYRQLWLHTGPQTSPYPHLLPIPQTSHRSIYNIVELRSTLGCTRRHYIVFIIVWISWDLNNNNAVVNPA